MCRPRKDEQGNVLPVQRSGNVNNAIKEEVLWKYVTAKNKVVIFEKSADLTNDIVYRQKIVAAARSAHFAYIGDGSGQKPPKMNPSHWLFQNVSTALGPVTLDLKNWKSPAAAYAAVQDVFTNPSSLPNYDTSVYATACQGGARLVALWAVAQTLGTQKFAERVGTAPLTGSNDLFEIRYVSASEEDKAFWIPGDWGNIANTSHNPSDPNQAGRDGENVIYLGGCYETNPTSFMNQAPFWGHGFGILTLQEMMDEISGWGPLKVDQIRRWSAPQKLSHLL